MSSTSTSRSGTAAPRVGAPTGPPRRSAVRARVPALLRVVGVLLAVVFFTGPLVLVASTAFSGRALGPSELPLFPPDPGLHNFADAWRLGGRTALTNSTIVVVVGLVLQMVVSAMAAYALARKRFRGASLALAAILATLMMPQEIIAIPLYIVLGQIPNPLAESGSLLNSRLGMILPIVGWALPIMILTEFMKAIPQDLEDAARIDGAGDFRIFFTIILPLCKPALGTCAIFGFTMIWDQYLLPLLVANDPDLYTLPLLFASFRNLPESSNGLLMAIAFMGIAPTVVVFLALQRFFQRGLLSGGVKG